MTIQKIKEKAEELFKNMDWKEFDNHDKRVVITPRDGAIYEELLNITFQVSEQTSLSMDSTYEYTMNSLEVISDAEGDTEDDIREAGYEIEADIYTGELTAWLAQSGNHVAYIDQVLEEGIGDKTTGYDILSLAQAKAKQEAFTVVLDYLLNL